MTTKTPKRSREELVSLAIAGNRAGTLRGIMQVTALYPTSARPKNLAEVRAIKAAAVAALDRLHFADLAALCSLAEVLATDHDGARWLTRYARSQFADALELAGRSAATKGGRR